MTVGTEPSMTDEIRRVVAEHARLSVPMAEVADDDDLYVAGMTSHASVSMLIALEEAFEVEFTEDLLLQSTFQSVNAIAAAVKGLLEDKKAAELGPRP